MRRTACELSTARSESPFTPVISPARHEIWHTPVSRQATLRAGQTIPFKHSRPQRRSNRGDRPALHAASEVIGRRSMPASGKVRAPSGGRTRGSRVAVAKGGRHRGPRLTITNPIFEQVWAENRNLRLDRVGGFFTSDARRMMRLWFRSHRCTPLSQLLLRPRSWNCRNLRIGKRLPRPDREIARDLTLRAAGQHYEGAAAPTARTGMPRPVALT